MFRQAHLLALKLFRRLPRRWRLFVVHRLAPNFTVGAICVVERDDGALLFLRHSYRRRWGLPGGLLQRGETVVDAARREAKEEVGLEIELIGEPVVVVDPEPRRVDVVFQARPLPGADSSTATPRSPEVVEVRWFSRQNLPELQHEASGALAALARRKAVSD
jgi:8-oxo-dGTP diphosphatase